MVTREDGEHLYYVQKDLVGSWVVITDEQGAVVDRHSFDAWGVHRCGDTCQTFSLFRRGFGGHEEMTEFGLINMNGRVYDPLIAMFLSPDPYIQAPDFSQSYNRYGYCLNNPFKFTDPSGEAVVTITAIIVCATVSGVINWAVNGARVDGSAFSYFAVGFVSGGVAVASGGASLLVQGAALAFSGFLSNSGNNLIKQIDSGQKVSWGGKDGVLTDGGIGALTGLASWGAGRGTGYLLKNFSVKIGSLNFSANSAVAVGIKEGIGGYAASFTGSALEISLETGDSKLAFGTAFKQGFIGFGISAVSGYSRRSYDIKIENRRQLDLKMKQAEFNFKVKEAQTEFPQKAGKIEMHHVTPKYLGGLKNGQLVPLDAAYHQQITNEFRRNHPYKLGPVSPERLYDIKNNVYGKFPLPPGIQW